MPGRRFREPEMPVEERVLDFIGDLREAGIPVTVSESMDACRAIQVAPLAGTGALREALRTTLVKTESDYEVFDAVFDQFFCGAAALTAGEPPHEGEEAGAVMTVPELAGMLERILLEGDEQALANLASMAAAAVGGREGGFSAGARPTSMMAGPGYYVFRAMEMLAFSDIAARVEEEAATGGGSGGLPPVLALEEVRGRIEVFKRELERQITRRLAMERGENAVSRKRKVPTRPEEIEFTSASIRQVEQMRRVLPALARKLAARLARRQATGKRGRVDIRNTIRHSISTGGVPLEVKYKKPVPSKPELFVLCDVSGSVRTFSNFTLQLVYSLHQQFRSVRSFVFVDRVDEVTDCFADIDIDDAVEKVFSERVFIDGDGHSDIGRAIRMFAERFGDEVGPRSTVMVLSDARNNARNPDAEALMEIHESARKVYWLNPEPSERWNTGDSVIAEYGRYCDLVRECRNLKQLAEFVYGA